MCKDLGLILRNKEEVRSRRSYNSYHIEYPVQFSSTSVHPQLLVETVFIQKAYPVEVKTVDALIGEWLRSTDKSDAIRQYEMYPFEIQVQTLERTLVDKVFALCDYMESDVSWRQSRHIYDISRLLKKINLDVSLKELIKKVRDDRKSNKTCLSARDGVNVSELLQKVIDTQYFKSDYESVTSKLLSKPVEYDEAIRALEKIIESGVFT